MNSESVIKSLLEAPQFVGLQKEVIEIAGRENIAPRKIIVIEQCSLTEAQRGRIEVEIKMTKPSFEFIPSNEVIGLKSLYIDLACTSFGDVPNFLEFTAMRPNDYSIWMNAAIRVNPVLFEWLSKVSEAIEAVDAELLKAEEEKKSATPPMSENG